MIAYHGAPSLQVRVTLDHQQHQLCLRSTQVKVHQPKNRAWVNMIRTARIAQWSNLNEKLNKNWNLSSKKNMLLCLWHRAIRCWHDKNTAIHLSSSSDHVLTFSQKISLGHKQKRMFVGQLLTNEIALDAWFARIFSISRANKFHHSQKHKIFHSIDKT